MIATISHIWGSLVKVASRLAPAQGDHPLTPEEALREIGIEIIDSSKVEQYMLLYHRKYSGKMVMEKSEPLRESWEDGWRSGLATANWIATEMKVREDQRSDGPIYSIDVPPGSGLIIVQKPSRVREHAGRISRIFPEATHEILWYPATDDPIYRIGLCGSDGTKRYFYIDIWGTDQSLWARAQK